VTWWRCNGQASDLSIRRRGFDSGLWCRWLSNCKPYLWASFIARRCLHHWQSGIRYCGVRRMLWGKQAHWSRAPGLAASSAGREIQYQRHVVGIKYICFEFNSFGILNLLPVDCSCVMVSLHASRRAAAHRDRSDVISAGVRGQRSREVSGRWKSWDTLRFSCAIWTSSDARRQISLDAERRCAEPFSQNHHHSFTATGGPTGLLELNFDLWPGHPVLFRSAEVHCHCGCP